MGFSWNKTQGSHPTHLPVDWHGDHREPGLTSLCCSIWTPFSHQKNLLLIPHEPLPLSSVQIGPFLQSLNRSAGFCQRNFPCCILTRCKQLMMNTAWLLLDLPKAFLATYLPQPLLAPAVCFHFSAGSLHPHHLPNATLPGSQLGRAALFSIIWWEWLAWCQLLRLSCVCTWVVMAAPSVRWPKEMLRNATRQCSQGNATEQRSSLPHNRQTSNPRAVYHKSLDPAFERESLISCKYM